MGGGGGADFFDIDVLGAAHLGDGLDDVARVDAEAAAADEAVGEAEIAEQLGEAGDQADDARLAGGGRVQGAEGVAKFVVRGHGGFYRLAPRYTVCRKLRSVPSRTRQVRTPDL